LKHRSEIDGLRAVAVIPVILFHAGFSTFSGGFVGVDIFFVISGYLIATIILANMEKGTFSLVEFYERRARRILPALFFVMLVSLFFAWLWLTPRDLKDFSQSLVAVSTFSSNFLFWSESGYWDVASELKPLLHTWSLGVEEQYYIIFPLFLMLMWRYRMRWIFGSFVLIAGVSFTAAELGSYDDPSATFYLLPTRGWELAIGAGIAFYFLHRKQGVRTLFPHKVVDEVLGLLGFFMIGYGVFEFDETTPFPGFYALAPTIGTGLIILFSSSQTIVGRLLSTKPLVTIGLISYSAYLWHQPLLAFARHRMAEPNEFIYGVLALLSFPIAYLSWRFVERPFRHKDTISAAGIFAFAAIGSVFFIAIGLIGHKTNGFFEFKTNESQKTAFLTALPSPKREQCHTGGANYRKPSDACEYHFQGSNWATFGDSHTVELAYALAELLRDSKGGVKHFSMSGCAPSYQQDSNDSACASWTNETVDYISKDPSIKNVVVSYRIHSALFGGHEAVYPEIPNEGNDGERNKVWTSYIHTLERLVETNKNVYLVLQAPEAPKVIDKLIMNQDNPVDVKGVSVEWWRKRSQFVRDRINEIPDGVKLIDPEELLCGTQYCYVIKNHVSRYFDDDHLSVEGAKIVASEILRR